MKNIHSLKIWPEYFIEVKTGRKTFEIRKLDRDYEVGDFLDLREWYPNGKEYSGDTVEAEITYITDVTEVMGLTEPVVAMSIRVASPN